MSTKTISNFDGSLTDFYIGADDSSYETSDNFVHNEYSKLISRPGTLLDFTTDATRARCPSAVNTRRVSLMAPQTTGTGRAFTLLKIAGDKINFDNGTTMTQLSGPSAGAFVGVSGVDIETGFSYAEWNKHTIITHDELTQIPIKVFNPSSGTLTLRTAGLPNPNTAFTATGGAGANYIYGICWRIDYTVNDITYTDRSAVYLKEFTGIGTTTPSSSPGVTVGSLPTLTNATGEHYDVSTTLKLEIYRTTNNGTVLYFIGQVDNGTTSFADTVSDNTADDNATLYTTGGVVGNDRPPKSKYVHGTSDFVYYANGVEVSATTGADLQKQPQRLWQSKRGDPDSVPTGFYADMEQEIVGISSMRSIPIVFCANSIYRIDGFYDNQGRGGMVPKKISDSIGAVGHLSLVQTIDGVYFAGNDGFYFTDGYQVQPASATSRLFKDRYFKLVDSALKRKRLYGAHDTKEQRVVWACASETQEAYDDDNAQCYVLDLRQPKPFDTWSSGFSSADEITDQVTGTNVGATVTIADTTGLDEGAWVFRDDELNPLQFNTFNEEVATSTTFNLNYAASNQTDKNYRFINKVASNVFYRNFLPTALCFANDVLWMGDRHGFTRYFSKEQPNDVWIDPSGITAPASFAKLPIFFNYSGPAMDLGTTEFRKYVSGVIVKARPRLDINAEMTLQLYGENDDNQNPHMLEPIFFESYYPWGTPAIAWGDPRLWRTVRTIIDVKRRMPAGKMRCEYKQIQMTPAVVKIYQSSVYANATIATSGTQYKTATITGTWPTDIAQFFFTTSVDGYVAQYRISERTSSTVIKIHDPDNTLATGSNVKWVAKGLLVNALINLIEYTLFFEIIGPSQQPYNGENTVSQ